MRDHKPAFTKDPDNLTVTDLPSASRLTWFTFAAPARFYGLAGALAPACGIAAALLALAGLWIGFFVAPTDAAQGEVYRIIFIHVPAAWMSMFIYVVMAFWSIVALTYNTRLSAMLAQALAPTGAWMTFIALFTGSMWGRPTWGTYWAWDARMTSELILLFLYFGVIALRNAIDDPRRADRACSLLTIVGAVNIPIIYFSVQWWNTLHPGASISLRSAPTMAAPMLLGLLLCTLGVWAYAIAAVLQRLRCIVLEREHDAQWIKHLPELAR